MRGSARLLAPVAASVVLALSLPASAHHREGPCDVHLRDDETVQQHSKRVIRCAVERWSVPGGAEKAICIADAESGLNPETRSAGGEVPGPVPAPGEGMARPLPGMDARVVGAGRERALGTDERHRHGPDRERRGVGRVAGRGRLLNAIPGTRSRRLPGHGHDRGTTARRRRPSRRSRSGSRRSASAARRCWTPARKDAVRKQHEKGKLTARERIELLLDATRSRKPTRSPSTARTTSGWIAIGPLGTAW